MFLGNGGANPRRAVSEDTSKAIDSEVKEIVNSPRTSPRDS